MKLKHLVSPFATAAAGRPVLSWAICPETGRPRAAWRLAARDEAAPVAAPAVPLTALAALIARHRMLRAA